METSAASLPIVPNDVLTEILARLPVKVLLRFRCVCKSWLSLVSSKEFVKTHHKISQTDSNFTHHKIILNYGYHDIRHCSFRSLLGDEPIIDSSDPILSVPFLASFNFPMGSRDGLCVFLTPTKDLILWNPCTRIYKKLPDFAAEGISSSYFAYGFGFDESTDDYKVVGFLTSDKDVLSGVVVKVYSLKSGKWTRIKDFNGRWMTKDPALFCNGKLLWIATTDWIKTVGGWECVWDIYSLDLEREEYGILEIPNDIKSCRDSHLVLSEDRLYVFCNHPTKAEVWIMGDYERLGLQSWTKVVTIPYIDYKYLLRVTTVKRVLCVGKDGRVVLYCSPFIVIFDSKDGSFRDRVIRIAYNLCETRDAYNLHEAFIYSESLF